MEKCLIGAVRKCTVYRRRSAMEFHFPTSLFYFRLILKALWRITVDFELLATAVLYFAVRLRNQPCCSPQEDPESPFADSPFADSPFPDSPSEFVPLSACVMSPYYSSVTVSTRTETYYVKSENFYFTSVSTLICRGCVQ